MILTSFVTLALLVGCGDPAATLSGSAGGLTFSETDSAYFGGPFLVFSNEPLDCLELAWVQRSYQDGVAPTDSDVKILQFTFAGDAIATGRVSIGTGAAATATVVNVTDGAPTYTRAESGFLDIDSLEEQETLVGSFDAVTFTDGTLTGDFTATWCRNLRM